MVNNMAAKGRIKLKVYLDENGRVSEVFVSQNTKCQDIVQRLQRQIRQTNCCLVEVWQGCERLVPEDELIYDTLLEWDSDLDDVIFFLRPNEDTVSLQLDTDGIEMVEEDLPLPPPPDPSLLMINKGDHENNNRSLVLGSSRSTMSLEELQQLAVRQQQEIALKEQQLANKELQLKELKQRTRQKIKSSYIDQLEAQIQEQDRKMRHLRQLQDQIEEYRLSNSVLDAELQSMEVHFNGKEQELAIAAAKVDGLTEQLNQQREKWTKTRNENNKSNDEQQLERLQQELMTRNELNHQQSIQLQAQKQLLAEKHKELFNLDSQIDQLTEELKHKKSQNTVNLNNLHNGADGYYDDDNGLWENGESFDWSEFTNAEDRYDEEVYANYNDSDTNEHCGNSRQTAARHLETLLEVDETSSVAYSKASAESSNVSSIESSFSPHSGTSSGTSRVSKLASMFEAETTNQHTSLKDDKPVANVQETYFNDLPREKSELVNSRMHQSSLDSGFSSKIVGSSPLSSPSSLSSLSSFSSSSSASKSLTKPDQYHSTNNSAETVLRSREMKTEGINTYAMSTFQEKPRTLYEARLHGDSGNEFQISRKYRGPGSKSTGFEPSSQETNTSDTHLKEHTNNTIPRQNASTDVMFYHTESPSTKPHTPTSAHKQDFPMEVKKPIYKTSSVSLVLSSPPVRDILSESIELREEPVQTGISSDLKNLSGSASEGNSHENVKRSSSTDSSTSASQPAITKVKVTLLSTGKPSKVMNKDEAIDESHKGNATPPGSPQSKTSRLLTNEGSLNDKTNSDIITPSSSANDEYFRNQSSRNLTHPRSPQNRIPRFHERSEQLSMQSDAITSSARSVIDKSQVPTFYNRENMKDHGTRNGTPPKSPSSYDPSIRNKQDRTKDINPFFQNKEEQVHHDEKHPSRSRSPLSFDSNFQDRESVKLQQRSSSSALPGRTDAQVNRHVTSHVTQQNPQRLETAPTFQGRNDSLFTQDKTNTTPPQSPNTSKFESWDGVRSQGKRTAKVQPVDSFNAKKVPVSFSPNAYKHLRTQKDDPMVYKQSGHSKQGERDIGSVNRLDSSLSTEKKKSRHVSLDPHAVLLDAAVEGELEQVKLAIKDVDDPSIANSDGITALHNAVCGNHEDVVQFLVEYGCDVNLPDSHGWTPLHCAAANNDIIMVQYLVENGACIFATTGLKHKTPALCCEKSLPGYKECVSYLEEIQKSFGVSNHGKVYALYAYSATEDDELSFTCGEELQVLRRGDSTEKEWWWAKNITGQLGYIPRNLFGMSPRVAPEV